MKKLILFVVVLALALLLPAGIDNPGAPVEVVGERDDIPTPEPV